MTIGATMLTSYTWDQQVRCTREEREEDWEEREGLLGKRRCER
ncbi:hypothetical protein BVRB_7g174090 [Beta vulgaris subsp. vulgaris]|nr:hypothetical protein BVRB_7g174090 [Beta vulgaris subsp. vulgaris]